MPLSSQQAGLLSGIRVLEAASMVMVVEVPLATWRNRVMADIIGRVPVPGSRDQRAFKATR